MGLMDKVKSQATQLAEKAQQAGQMGQAKLAEVQAKRKADALLLELGGISYHQRVGRDEAGGEARAAELVDMIQKHEAEHGAVTVTSANAAVAEASGVVDPTATVPTQTVPTQTVPTQTVPTQTAAPAAPPPASGGAIPQAQYGAGQSEG